MQVLHVVCGDGKSERASEGLAGEKACASSRARERLDEIASGEYRFPSEPGLPTERAPRSYGGLATRVCSCGDSGCTEEIEDLVHGFGERVATFGEFGRRLLLLHERLALPENRV